MAGSQIKPSRWTYFFFGGLVSVLVGRIVWARHDQSQFTREAPLAHTTRRLLRCVLGRDAQRLLDSRAAAQGGNGVLSWTDKIEDRLRRTVAIEANATWPSRCLPIAERLETRLSTELHAQRAQRAAMDARQLLTVGAARRIELLRAVESGDLATALSTLAYEVSGMTSATEEGWGSPLRPDANDLWPVHTVSFPHAAPIPAEADSAQLVQPDMLVYQSTADRRMHRVMFDANETPSDRALGRGAPVLGDVREDAFLVAADDGDSLFVPSGEPSALMPLAEAVRSGDEPIDGWSALANGDSLTFASVTGGVVRVRSTSRTGAVQWRDARTYGTPDEVFAAVLVPTDDGAPRLATLDRGPNSIAVSVRTLDDAPPALGGSEASAPPASHPGGEWLTFDPRIRVCESAHARHVLLFDRFSMRAIRLDARGGVSTQDIRLDTLGPLLDRRAEWHCNDTHALFFADFEHRSDTMMVFDYGESSPRLPRAPLLGAGASLAGAALTRDRLVTVVANPASLRAYDISLADLATTSDESIIGWNGGALLALESRADADAHREERTVRVMQMLGRDDQVAMLAWVIEGTRGYAGRLASRDGGRTFQGD